MGTTRYAVSDGDAGRLRLNKADAGNAARCGASGTAAMQRRTVLSSARPPTSASENQRSVVNAAGPKREKIERTNAKNSILAKTLRLRVYESTTSRPLLRSAHRLWYTQARGPVVLQLGCEFSSVLAAHVAPNVMTAAQDTQSFCSKIVIVELVHLKIVNLYLFETRSFFNFEQNNFFSNSLAIFQCRERQRCRKCRKPRQKWKKLWCLVQRVKAYSR